MFSIHSSGELYCWGVGLSGRLGLDETVGGMPQKSIEKPTLVQALRGQLVVQVPGGRSHSAAVTVTGRWGHFVTAFYNSIQNECYERDVACLLALTVMSTIMP